MHEDAEGYAVKKFSMANVADIQFTFANRKEGARADAENVLHEICASVMLLAL